MLPPNLIRALAKGTVMSSSFFKLGGIRLTYWDLTISSDNLFLLPHTLSDFNETLSEECNGE